MLRSGERELVRKLIFNPQGERDANRRRIVRGNPTNIIELNNIKYGWAFELYKTMGFSNFWIPEEIPLLEDRKQYERQLSDYEKRAYELVLSFLIALDSFQVDMLKDFGRMVTAPEIEMAITAQEFQESIHAYSYQFILESVVDPLRADEIYNYWREDELLRDRNQVVAEVYNEFIKKPSEENFVKAVIGNYILESLYFYSGFAFFYTLGRQGKMTNTVQQIKYINRDELTHVTLFRNLILTLRKEDPELFTPEIVRWIEEYFRYAVDQEIRWGQYVTQNQDPLYPEITENPMKWIDDFRKINNTKTDFFQRKPQTYAKANELRW